MWQIRHNLSSGGDNKARLSHHVGDEDPGGLLLSDDADAEALAGLLHQLDLDLLPEVGRVHLLALPVDHEGDLQEGKLDICGAFREGP